MTPEWLIFLAFSFGIPGACAAGYAAGRAEAQDAARRTIRELRDWLSTERSWGRIVERLAVDRVQFEQECG